MSFQKYLVGYVTWMIYSQFKANFSSNVISGCDTLDRRNCGSSN